MTSPFPGMDPYLEQSWSDVHQRIITYACDQIQDRLPGDLRARMQQRVVIGTPGGTLRAIYPDVHVAERRDLGGPAGASAAESVVIAEPLIVMFEGKRTEAFIEIIDIARGGRLVTVIEILSAANKHPGRDMEKYLKKREELGTIGVSFVEIDLLREGRRILLASPDLLPPSHRATYQACAQRAWNPDAIEVYPLPIRERLPVIGIPLRESDPDIPLDLQALIDQAYRHGRYDDIDYRAEPMPPLDPDDAAWADALLRERGRR